MKIRKLQTSRLYSNINYTHPSSGNEYILIGEINKSINK